MADKRPLVPVGTAPNFTAIGELLTADRLDGVVNDADLSNNSVASKNNAGVVTPTVLGSNTILGNIGSGIAALTAANQRTLMNTLYTLTTTGQVLAYNSGTSQLVTIAPGTNGQALIYNNAVAGGLQAGSVASELDGLSDVTLSAEATGHTLRYNGAVFVNTFLNLADLGDVDLTGIADGDTLVWDSGTSTWLVGAAAGTTGVDASGLLTAASLDMDSKAISDVSRVNFDVGIALYPSSVNNNWAIIQTGTDLLIGQTPWTSAEIHFSFKDDETLRLYKYANTRDDGSAVLNYLCTDATGVLRSLPITDLAIPAGLGNLGDVDLVTNPPTDAQVLTYVTADSKWVAATPTAATFINLATSALDMADYNVNNVGILEFRDYGASKWTVTPNGAHLLNFTYGASLRMALYSTGEMALTSYGSLRADDAGTFPMDNILYTTVSGVVVKARLDSIASSGASVTTNSFLYINSSNVFNKLSLVNIPAHASQAAAAAAPRSAGDFWKAATPNSMGVPPGTLFAYTAGDRTEAARTTRSVSGASNTILLADAGKHIECDHGSANSLVIPTNAVAAIPINSIIYVTQIGAGLTTIAGPGVTLTALGGVLDLGGQWGTATLMKRDTDSWLVTVAGVGGGSGDVTKVGTPANNQVGVWTGDGTIEGAGTLTYNGTALAVTGNITVSGTVDGRDVDTDGTKLDGIEALAEVTSTAKVNAAGAVMESDYNAHTILQATTDNTPVAITVSEQTLVGRITGGNITALSIAQILTLLGLDGAASVQTTAWDIGTTYNPNDVVVDDDSLYLQNSGSSSTGEDPALGAPWFLLCRGITSAERTKLGGIEALADVTDATNVNAAGAVMESDYNAHTILQATTDNTPVAITVGEQTVVGRITGGNIVALTVAQLITLIGLNGGTTDQVLGKTSGTDGAWSWRDGGGYPETLAASHDYISGRFYPLVGIHNAHALTTQALGVNRADLQLFTFDRSITFDQLGVYVTTGSAGNAKVLVYDVDADGWPDNKIYESGNLDTTSSSNFAHATTSLPTFAAGTRYWIGVIADNGATVRGVAPGGTRSLGMNSSGDASVTYAIRRSGLTFATPPDPWTFTSTDLTSANTPIVIGRAT